MPTVIIGSPQNNEQVWQALKVYISRERKRKRQEEEADAEVERQRKERERQQKQDVMTLGETREQISTLETELAQLKSEKHQLFVQLKKVLHEDDNRRRLIKETVCSESMPTGGYMDQGTPVVHSHLYLPLPTRHPPYKVAVATPTHMLLPGGPLKRSHSPSPPLLPQSTTFHPNYFKTISAVQSYMPPPPKSEDAARRSGDSRAVLWNKNNQYPASSFYSTTAGQSVYSYTAPPSQPPSREPEPGKPVYLSANRPQLPTIQPGPYTEDKFYPRPGSHVTVHGGAIPIQQPPQGAKTGSITSGYPVRAPQPPPGAYPPPPPGTYVNVSSTGVPARLMYTQPSPRYLQRDL